MSMLNKPLGGYLEIEPPKYDLFNLTEPYKFCSARAAFLSIVDQLKVSRVRLPKYLGNTMISILYGKGVNLSFLKIM